MKPDHRFVSESNLLHALCDACGHSRTDAIHAITEDIHVTVWNQPGTGREKNFQTRGAFLDFALQCIADNVPFTVGHTFGNIDGTHPKREMPIIQPRIRPTRVITAGELKPDLTIIEAGRAFKVGNVRHTEDGYTYYSMRSLTGEPYQNDNACTLSIAGITVEAR
jgi:hypothetical protein